MQWVVGGERLQGGTRLPPIRAYIDDMTTLTATVPCTSQLIAKSEIEKDGSVSISV